MATTKKGVVNSAWQTAVSYTSETSLLVVVIMTAVNAHAITPTDLKASTRIWNYRDSSFTKIVKQI